MVREGYKETEIGEIPVEWEICNLNQLLEQINQTSPEKNPRLLYKYIDVSSISRSRLKITAYSEYLGRNAPSRARKVVKTGDIIFSTVRPYLKQVALIPPYLNNELCSTAFCVIRCNESVLHNLFCFYYVTQDKFLQIVSRYESGSNYPAVLDRDIICQHIPHPPLPEQRRIAAVLSTLDDVIEKTEALIDKLRQVKAGLMQALLTKGIDEEGRVRSEETHAFCEKSGMRVPVEWEVVAIGDVLSEVVEPIVMRDDKEYRLISIRRRNGGIFERERLLGKNILTKDLHRVIPGTFLIANRQIVHGACAYVTEEFADAAVSSAYTTLKSRDNCDIQFFSWLAKTPLMYKYFLDASQGVVLEKMNFHLQEWLAMPIFLPPIPEQHRIAAVLSTADDRIAREEAYRDKLLALKQGLMADLLTGEVRVPEGVRV